MTEHDHHHDHGHAAAPRRVVERHTDVAIVGGSAAGLGAALQLARQRRSVIVVDAGDPRNAPAPHMHGYLGHEGVAPADFTATARAEVRSYGVEVLDGRATDVRRDGEGFRVELTGGHAVVARRLVVATGLVDQLPDLPGVAEGWGRDVIHCPFCHGYEVRDRRVVQIVTHPMGLHPAPLFRRLTERLTIVLHDREGVDAAELDALRDGGVEIVDERVDRLERDAAGRLDAVLLSGGRRIGVDAVVVGPRFAARAEPFAGLGLATAAHPSGLGDVVPVDAMGQTGITGVYAAGNVTDPSLQVLHAAAAGNWVGAMVAFDLARDDLAAAARPSANAADWDHRYGGERIWSGNPNGTLVAEVEGLAPGRVLDVGAGEGGDAVWLAEHGWAVTASDISARGLAHVDAEARRRGLRVDLVHADANADDPFGGATFDLVSAQYASIPRTPDDRGLHNLLGAVAPGGTLLAVGHDLAPMRAPIDTSAQSRMFDGDAYLGVADIASAIRDDPAWEIEVDELRPRPPGAASASHHVDDVVLRARRRDA